MSRQETGGSRTGGGRVLALAEWVFAGLGAAFLVGVLGHLSWSAAVHENAPPEISVRAVSVTAAGERYVVRFEGRIQGGETAAGVVIKGRLQRGSETVEEAETTLDYAPARSTREGALAFANDPASFRLVLGAAGYHKP